MKNGKKQHGRYLEIDPSKLTSILNQRSISVEVLAGIADVSVGTINNMLRGKRSLRSRVLSVADALGTSPATLLRECQASYGVATIHEYLVAEVVTDWMTASNGLRFQICRLRHVELDRQARGKRFDLRDMTTDEQQRCRTWIKRHPNVCESLRGHPNIARNLTAFHDPTESYYWVIDEWIDGESLQRKLECKQSAEAVAKSILLDIARGLQGLHEQGVIRRELSPAAILIRNTDGRAVLTEFELAKLIDRGPTVSTDSWPIEPYRAGEADGDDVDVRADIYSWARIGIHLLTGQLCEVGSEGIAVESVDIPNSVSQCLVQSSAIFRSNRPKSFAEILSILENWK